MQEIIVALIKVLPTTILGILGYIIAQQNLENSWRQILNSISNEFWNDKSVK